MNLEIKEKLVELLRSNSSLEEEFNENTNESYFTYEIYMDYRDSYLEEDFMK